jgi:hypothetical protein
MIKETNLAPGRSEFLQTTLAADGHLAEGQFFLGGRRR